VTQPPQDDIKALWQGQQTETPTMTIKAVRALARNYGDNIRGRIWMGVAIGAVEVFTFSLYAWRAPNDVLRAGWLITLAGVGWMVWRIASKWPPRLPPTETSAKALIEFHRAQLERQRTGPAWITVTAAPIFAGAFVVLLGFQKARPTMFLANVAPLLVLIVAWWVAAFVLQRRQARRLAEQIAEMDDLTKI
jgi:hypothetical protein